MSRLFVLLSLVIVSITALFAQVITTAILGKVVTGYAPVIGATA